MKKYRLTLVFIVTSVVFIAVTAIVVNRIIARVVEANLISHAEEHSVRNALHIQSTVRRVQSLDGYLSAADNSGASAMHATQPTIRLSLKDTAHQLPDIFPALAEGLSLVKLNLFDLAGAIVWSTDPETLGINKWESPQYQEALGGGISSTLARDQELDDWEGVHRRIDVVETYLPLRETPSGRMLGVMDIFWDVSPNVLIQIDGARDTILLTIVGAMGGLFVVLVASITIGDVTVARAARREMELVETQLAERKQAQEVLEQRTRELAQSNAELNQFANVASHDLQEPLRAIVGFTKMLERKYAGKLDTNADTLITRTVNAATRMHALVDDLLMYSRVGSKVDGTQPTNCEAVVDQEIDSLGVAITETGAEVTRAALPTVTANPSLVSQVFANLIANAIKFHGDRTPRVHVSAVRQEHDWVFSVQDKGVGLELEYAERIFDIFQRLHTRTEYPGTGIGLAICKKAVERLGGRIWVESQPGEGATFRFTIPATEIENPVTSSPGPVLDRNPSFGGDQR